MESDRVIAVRLLHVAERMFANHPAIEWLTNFGYLGRLCAAFFVVRPCASCQ